MSEEEEDSLQELKKKKTFYISYDPRAYNGDHFILH